MLHRVVPVIWGVTPAFIILTESYAFTHTMKMPTTLPSTGYCETTHRTDYSSHQRWTYGG